MKQDWKGLGSYGTVGLEVVLSMLFGLFIGRWLDAKLGTEPVLTVLWFFFGIAAGGRSIWRTWKSMQAEAAREEREQGNPEPLYDPGEKTKREGEERDER
jgi:F0F1-type ATP synthase assembly protein I